jgi:hypothetical protein
MKIATANRFKFQGSPNEVIEHIRWCRANLGILGEQWDFASSRMGKCVDVWIVDSSKASWYVLKFKQSCQNES